jgi:endonuclease G, mitochondrial
VSFDTDYSKRKGFDEAFLGKNTVIHLPKLSPSLEKVASPLLQPVGPNKNVLHYHNYSLVMHAERRFAIYSAANVRADQRFDMGRPTDVWRTDPRIEISHQTTDFYYKKNQFDRGHLTRREDLEYGPTAVDALSSAADTCHWSNATPQHARFNQNKSLWQGIERHLLEGAITTGQYNTQVVTGPVLEEDDPVYTAFPNIQYPVRFWKVVSTLKHDGTLFATAFLLDQSDVIAEFGIESTKEIPFEGYKTFQVKIAEIERLTQLTFEATVKGTKKSLSEFDPLENQGISATRRRRVPRLNESTAIGTNAEGYRLISDLSEIVQF